MRLDERGKQCPLPVIEAKKALEKAEPGSVVEVVVDNEIAVQNLKKLALHKGLDSLSEKVSEREFLVKIWAGVKEKAEQVRENAEQAKERAEQARESAEQAKEMEEQARESAEQAKEMEEQARESAEQEKENAEQAEKESMKCALDCREKGLVLVLASDEMGQGDAVLGRLLMKGFVYAVTQQDKLPETVLLFNGGAKLSCQGSDSLEDLKELEAQGVEILTCGTCLNHYGIAEKLLVGNVTNMYEIVEKMTGAKKIVRP